jgi:hypothetical protein
MVVNALKGSQSWNWCGTSLQDIEAFRDPGNVLIVDACELRIETTCIVDAINVIANVKPSHTRSFCYYDSAAIRSRNERELRFTVGPPRPIPY